MPDDIAAHMQARGARPCPCHVCTQNREIQRALSHAARQMAARVGTHEPDRGAVAVTIRARMTEGERLQRHAAWRLPMGHADSPLIDRLHAAGVLDHRQYANACACARLWIDCGQGRSRGVASWLREAGDGPGGVQRGPEDEWRELIRVGGVGMQAVCMLLRDEVLGPYMLKRATDHLDKLDAVAARWEGERWRDE